MMDLIFAYIDRRSPMIRFHLELLSKAFFETTCLLAISCMLAKK